MLPLHDTVPRETGSPSYVNWALLLITCAVFLLQLSGSERVISDWGMTPSGILYALQYGSWGAIAPLFTSIFLHGGWMHLIGNMLFLHIFGDNVEHRLGHFRYLSFYLLGGILANVAHIASNTTSDIPTIGASGAVAAVLGAYIIFFPHARITTWIPPMMLTDIPAFMYLGLWFTSQVLSGLTSLALTTGVGGIAWWAHIGGFAVGATIGPLLQKRRSQRDEDIDDE